MALTCSLTLDAYGGLALAAAYIRVASAEAYKVLARTNPAEEEPPVYEERLMARYSASVYLDDVARANRKNPLDTAAGVFAWDIATTPNILSACYAHLKAQETYAAATDC